MKVLVSADAFDFRSNRLTFCFAGVAPGAAGSRVHSSPGKLISESSQGALFEVRVPPDIAEPISWDVPAGSGLQAVLSGWVGKDANLRILGKDGDKIVFDMTQPFVVSNFTIALLSGFAVILLLMALSGLILREINPFKVIHRLSLHRTMRFSLSNVQILLWTLLVLYAFCFVWMANGMLLDISSGVLVLLGISGGTSVLSRAVDNYGKNTEGSKDRVASLKDLIVGDQGEFDLLRFQMLGFTLFTLSYAFISVIQSEGLPEIPQNLYLTDNDSAFRSREFAAACRQLGIRHRFTRPYRPQTNGKAERFIQSALREWAYGFTYQNSSERVQALDHWLHHYNWHRPHQGIGGVAPMTRLNRSRNNLLTLHS